MNQIDIPDMIAGALGVSRGTAYDMMREALAEQPAQLATEQSSAVQPVVPDAFGTREGEHPEYIQGWNDCRAEMLRGTPAQRTWKKLTDAETEHLWEISRAAIPRYHTFKTLIEKALRERNT